MTQTDSKTQYTLKVGVEGEQKFDVRPCNGYTVATILPGSAASRIPWWECEGCGLQWPEEVEEHAVHNDKCQGFNVETGDPCEGECLDPPQSCGPFVHHQGSEKIGVHIEPDLGDLIQLPRDGNVVYVVSNSTGKTIDTHRWPPRNREE